MPGVGYPQAGPFAVLVHAGPGAGVQPGKGADRQISASRQGVQGARIQSRPVAPRLLILFELLVRAHALGAEHHVGGAADDAAAGGPVLLYFQPEGMAGAESWMPWQHDDRAGPALFDPSVRNVADAAGDVHSIVRGPLEVAVRAVADYQHRMMAGRGEVLACLLRDSRVDLDRRDIVLPRQVGQQRCRPTGACADLQDPHARFQAKMGEQVRDGGGRRRG